MPRVPRLMRRATERPVHREEKINELLLVPTHAETLEPMICSLGDVT